MNTTVLPVNGPTTIETSTLEEKYDNQTLEAKYWNDYFENDRQTEWLMSWSTCGPFLKTHLPKDNNSTTIAIGTGNSSFPRELQKEGYCPKLIASDFSPTVIDTMKRQQRHSPPSTTTTTTTSSSSVSNATTKLTYEVQDARKMTYEDESVNLVIDKSLLDCMYWAENRSISIRAMIKDIHRVLKTSGKAIFITQRNPIEVEEYFNLVEWESIEFIPIAAKTNENGDVVPGCSACLESVFDDYFDETEFYELIFIYICIKKKNLTTTTKTATATKVNIEPYRNMEIYESMPPTNTFGLKKRVRSLNDDNDEIDEEDNRNKKRIRLNEEEEEEDTSCPKMCAFADNVPNLVSWGKSFHLEEQINNNNGIVIIDNFLPNDCAVEIRNMLLNTNENLWKLNSDTGEKDDTPHQFLSFSSHPDPGYSSVTRTIWSLMTDRLPNFSAARYNATDHINMHDDSLIIPANIRENSYSDGESEGSMLYRDIAVVLYMVDDDWNGEKDGGILLDWGPTNNKYKEPMKIVPKFNRIVFFQVPRYHEVTKVLENRTNEDNRPRLSVFGWFLTDKQLY
jgi:SAM-dependent methyltransferase